MPRSSIVSLYLFASRRQLSGLPTLFPHLSCLLVNFSLFLAPSPTLHVEACIMKIAGAILAQAAGNCRATRSVASSGGEGLTALRSANTAPAHIGGRGGQGALEAH